MPRSIIRLSFFLPSDKSDKLSTGVILCTPHRGRKGEGGEEPGTQRREKERRNEIKDAGTEDEE